MRALVGDLDWGAGSAEILSALAAIGLMTILVSDFRGWTSWLQRHVYRLAGGWLWPCGDEHSYLLFSRVVAGVVLAGSLALLGIGIATLVG
jgi:hypothetical protein